MIEAWAPTREACLREAVLGLAEVAAHVVPDGRVASMSERIPVVIDAGDDEELVVALLEEVIYALDARGAVTVDAHLEARGGMGVDGWLVTVPSTSVTEVGATPKGVSRSELSFAADGSGTWRCQVEIDV